MPDISSEGSAMQTILKSFAPAVLAALQGMVYVGALQGCTLPGADGMVPIEPEGVFVAPLGGAPPRPTTSSPTTASRACGATTG
jgi:hypothetical protein